MILFQNIQNSGQVLRVVLDFLCMRKCKKWSTKKMQRQFQLCVSTDINIFRDDNRLYDEPVKKISVKLHF